MTGVRPADVPFATEVDVLIVGAGACGLIAGLAAVEQGAEVLIIERDRNPAGSTSMSSGFIPAAGTRAQRMAGMADRPAQLAADIQAKAKGRAEPALVDLATQTIGPVIDWLHDRGLEWQVLDGFLYPGHSAYRMHAVPERTGAALMTRLLNITEEAGIPILTEARADTLLTNGPRVAGTVLARPDGEEWVGCRALVLACNGYGGNRNLVARHIPQMASAPYYGHAGNTGDAIIWGEALGAEARCLSACQGHGSLAVPQNILISWALMMEGGIQVNAEGRRFSDETQGYSEQSLAVLEQPGGVAWCVIDGRLLELARQFPDFREAEAASALRSGSDAGGLASATGLPAAALAETLAAPPDPDPFGRRFNNTWLTPPYHAVKVTGALFHTQGGLMIDATARVLRSDGTAFPNLFAGGGAACGVSGPELSGYLSGNGLLTAAAFGWLAGHHAAQVSASSA